jgi:hypothetical protein
LELGLGIDEESRVGHHPFPKLQAVQNLGQMVPDAADTDCPGLIGSGTETQIHHRLPSVP